MCLGIPGKVLEFVDPVNQIAKVEVSGVRRNVNVGLVTPDGLDVGDWVLIHVGFAISRIDDAGVLVVNVMASPGAGKTSLIAGTIEATRGRLHVGVIEGDIAGSIDTETVLRAGATDAVQINTGGSCHLEAGMLQNALDDFDVDQLDVIFVENVGNLVCPTHWPLGEHLKLCIASVPEGHDKPVKYPELFRTSDVVILNKIDLIDFVDFDRDFFYDSLRALNAGVPVFEVSCRTGDNLSAWVEWLLVSRSEIHAVMSGVT